MSSTTFVSTTGSIVYLTSSLPEVFRVQNGVFTANFSMEILNTILEQKPVILSQARDFVEVKNFCEAYGFFAIASYVPQNSREDFASFLYEDPSLGIAFGMSKIGDTIFSGGFIIGRIKDDRVFVYRRCPQIEALSFPVTLVCKDGEVEIPSCFASCNSIVPCSKRQVTSAFAYLEEYHYGRTTGLCRASIQTLLDCNSEYVQVFRGKGNVTDDVKLLMKQDPLSKLLSKYSIYDDKIFRGHDFMGTFSFSGSRMTITPQRIWKDVGKIVQNLSKKGVEVLLN